MTASLRERVLSGERLVGTFVQTPSPVVAELLAAVGVDFVCIDQEHAAIGAETAQVLIAAATAGGVPAVVRVREGTRSFIGSGLDSGAAGVLVPRVSSAAQAADVARAARYPPAGERSVGAGRAAGYGRRIAEALAGANEETLVAVQIETRAALGALDDILAVAGIDLVFVGPGDLSASLGLEAGLRDPRLRPIVDDIVDRARKAGRAAGVFAIDVDVAITFGNAQFLVVGSDLTFLADAVEDAFERLRR